MQISSKNTGISNGFDFSMTTSSGDKISLNAFDNKSISYDKDDSNGIKSLTLSHKYGYKISYEGDGLDEKDIKEIDEALKSIKPKLENFMKKIKDDEPFSNTDFTNLAHSIKKYMPDLADINSKNYLSNGVLDMFDKLLVVNKADDNMIEKSKKLFDEITKQMDRLSFYA